MPAGAQELISVTKHYLGGDGAPGLSALGPCLSVAARLRWSPPGYGAATARLRPG